MSCQICEEKLNKSTQKPIECILCEGEPKPICCFKCFSTFLLTSSNIIPSCMFCNNELTLDFVHSVGNKTFIDQYNSYRFEKRFEIEKSRLPETQEEANRIKCAIQRERDIKRLHNMNTILYHQKKMLTDDLKFFNPKKNSPEEYATIKEEIERLDEEYRTNSAAYNRLHFQRLRTDKEERKKEAFIKACPDDRCRGFLSTAYKCGTCDTYFCPDCNDRKVNRTDDTHVCNEEMKSTMDLIKSDSKPCPKCRMMIFKISGCSQMWCVQCHTAFNWNTGIIQNGHIHNPEYFRYLRETGQNIPRNPMDFGNGCMRLPAANDVRQTIGYGELHGRQYIWTGWYDYVNHIRGYILPNEIQNFRDMDYSEYRIGYLNGELTESEWKKVLKMRMKKDELQMERFLILDMFCNVITDLFINLMENRDLDLLNDSALKIFEYTNTQMEKLNKKFSSKDKRYFLNKEDNRIRRYFDV
jgi:hypothetical protein